MSKSILYIYLLIIAFYSCSSTTNDKNKLQYENHSIKSDIISDVHNNKVTDSVEVSDLFINEMKKMHHSVEVKNGSVIINKTNILNFPDILPLKKAITYKAKQDNLTFEITLKRLNLTDIKYTFISKNGDSIEQKRTDIVPYNPFERSSCRKYGFSCSAIKYSAYNKNSYTGISIEKEYANYVKFYYKDYTIRANSIENIPMLTKVGIEEPYEIYLHKTIEKIREYPENKKHQQDFDQIIEDITSSAKEYKIEHDTLALDMAAFYKLDYLINTLRKLGVKDRKTVSSKIAQRIPESKIFNIRASIRISKDGEVLSNRFEKYNYNNLNNYSQPIPGYKYFNSSYGNTHFYKFNNEYIAILQDDGFENVSNIFTIWEKQDTIFQLKAILDQQIRVGIGGAEIDTILKVNDESVIIGNSFGGDAGDTWGTFWIAQWKKPRDLNFIYWKDWNAGFNDYFSSDFEVDNNIVTLINKHTKLNLAGERFSKNDTIVLVLDTLVNKDRTIEFNSRY